MAPFEVFLDTVPLLLLECLWVAVALLVLLALDPGALAT